VVRESVRVRFRVNQKFLNRWMLSAPPSLLFVFMCLWIVKFYFQNNNNNNNNNNHHHNQFKNIYHLIVVVFLISLIVTHAICQNRMHIDRVF
jgi:heme/copper-type cytochrome/quinol oxidase subunit 2